MAQTSPDYTGQVMTYEIKDTQYVVEGGSQFFTASVTLKIVRASGDKRNPGIYFGDESDVKNNILYKFKIDGWDGANSYPTNGAVFTIKIKKPDKYWGIERNKVSFAKRFWGYEKDPLALLFEQIAIDNDNKKSVLSTSVSAGTLGYQHDKTEDDETPGGSKRKNLRITRRKKSRKRAH
jgi:hypothetical protein